ncbi:type II secretion system major pseudopilin GspG [Pelomonas sp. SE-A7]|uniref:type II secretion system major pseudopilin GspG n=1 Tax=Pelomonas sp. SE-A7 TaxID=3054953 RepID=UPI00259C9B1D|nr:type II secretion system major pseudopilin GspG [Pelomonas sp. SE-A7]MDM4766422.1 type II secretion system major pseudopilin GspG [Pelomonas sp. SE-A7]
MSSSPSLRRSTRPSDRRSRSQGFTLIEVMVVMVIIGVMATMVTVAVMGRAAEAKVTAARADVASLMQALKMYKLDNNRYPTSEQGLEALVRKPSIGPIPPNWKPYIEKLPVDPWKSAYQYANPGIKGEIDVYSFGADQKAGGEGDDADIGSWQ